MGTLNSEQNTTPNREAIKNSILEMLDELTNAEALELEDFIVNHCDNASFIDDNGDFPNLFRIFVTGHREDLNV
jgi:hypothetical protein